MSKLPNIELKPTIRQSVDSEVVPVFQKSKKIVPIKGPYASVINRFKKAGLFDAAYKKEEYIRFGGEGPALDVLFAGMGDPSKLSEERARVMGAGVYQRLSREKARSAVISIDPLLKVKGLKTGVDQVSLVKAFTEGMLLASYEFEKYKTLSKAKKTKGPGGEASPAMKLTFHTREKSTTALKKALEDAQAIVKAVNVTRDWSNEPANYGTPTFFANECKRLAKEYGLKCKVLLPAEIKREKMGLLLGVANGSEEEPRVVVLQYTPKAGGKSPGHVGLVGKGVTFDSGGISIKPAARMNEMKHDMTGAATVLGGILMAAALKAPNKVTCVMGFVENMPSGRATKPGDVHTSRAGKTVEIDNTDAEGRLVLADCLDYIQTEYKPEAIVNAATLIGAVGVCLGNRATAVLSNEDEMADSVIEAGKAVGEKFWQMPCWDEYLQDMRSPVADFKNIGKQGLAGTVTAGVFLKQFIRKEVRWAHLDIAYTAWNVTHYPYLPKEGASGLVVRTLGRLILDF